MLTDTRCRNAKPKEKPFKLTDGKGLHLEVKPSGVKSWRYRFELFREGGRKESVFAIGNYAQAPAGETEEETKARRNGGCFTLAEAREAAVTSQEALVAFVNGLSEASNTEETFGHFLFGPLNCRQWAVFQRVHDGDHGNQIEKIKAADGFPSA